MTFEEYFEKEGALTKSELARLVGLTPSAIGHYATGRRSPSQADAAKIAQAANEPALYAHWYPSLEEQLERMAPSPAPITQDREVAVG